MATFWTSLRHFFSGLVADIRRSEGRLAFVDTLRGFAALYVLLFHIVMESDGKVTVPLWLSPFVAYGGSGVTLFFILSAFTLCYTTQGKTVDAAYVVRFYARRFFRIAPLYYAWLAVMVSRGWWASDFVHRKAEIASCIFFVFNLVPKWQGGVVWAGWTLGIEMLFYLIFPLIFLYVRSIRHAVAFLLATLVLATVHDRIAVRILGPDTPSHHYVALSLLHHLPIFAMGILAYFIWLRLRALPPARGTAIVLIAIGLVGYLLLILLPMPANALPFYLVGVIYVMLFLGISQLPPGWVGGAPAAFLGIISYSIYLDHSQIVLRLPRVYERIDTLPIGITGRFALLVTLTLLLVLITATLTYLLIERPMIRLGSRLLGRRDNAPVLASNTTPQRGF